MASATLASSPFLSSLPTSNPKQMSLWRLPARRIPVAATAAPSGPAAAARERQRFLERYGLNPDDFEDDAEEDSREERRDMRRRSGKGEEAAEVAVAPAKAAEPRETHKLLQVLSGKVRRRKLLSPKGSDVPPMMEVVRGAAFDILQSAGGSPASLRPGKYSSFDYISVTPPYLEVNYSTLLDQLARSPLVGKDCFILVEYPLKTDMAESCGDLIKIADRRFGRTNLH